MGNTLLVVSLVIAAACSSSKRAAPGASQSIGVAGGMLTATQGAITGSSVVVPANALTGDVTITINAGTQVATAAGTTKVGPAVRFGPAGTMFSIDATVTIPFTTGQVPAGRLVEVAVRNDTTGVVTIIGSAIIDTSAGTATLDLSSFDTTTLQAFISPAPPTFDATGSWVAFQSNNFSNPAGYEDVDFTSLVSVTQTGSDVTVTADGIDYTGTVAGAVYSVSATYMEDGGTVVQTIEFTLADMDMGSGTNSWTFTDTGGTITGGSDLDFHRQMAATFDATGDWDVTFSNNFSIPAGNEDPDGTIVVPVTQTGNDISITIGGITHNGFVSGADYVINFLEDGGDTEVRVEFTLTTSDAGTGITRWRFDDDVDLIDGGADLTLARVIP